MLEDITSALEAFGLPFWQLVVVTALSSILSATFTMLIGRSSFDRTRKFDHLDRQLFFLYGPLRTLRHAGENSFRAFKKHYFPNQELLFEEYIADPSDPRYFAWRIWLEHVLLPINEQVERRLLDYGDLLIEDKTPDSVISFFAHSASVRALVARWRAGAFDEFHSFIDFPVEFNNYVDQSFAGLRDRRWALRSVGLNEGKSVSNPRKKLERRNNERN